MVEAFFDAATRASELVAAAAKVCTRLALTYGHDNCVQDFGTELEALRASDRKEMETEAWSRTVQLLAAN